MPGQMIPRGTDRWLLRVYVGRDAAGKRRYASQTVRGSKREAQRELTKMLRGKDTKTLLRPSRETVGAYLARWLDTWAAPRVRPRTLGDYRSIVRTYLEPVVGSVRLSHLNPSEIQDLYNGMLARGLSAQDRALCPQCAQERSGSGGQAEPDHPQSGRPDGAPAQGAARDGGDDQGTGGGLL